MIKIFGGSAWKNIPKVGSSSTHFQARNELQIEKRDQVFIGYVLTKELEIE